MSANVQLEDTETRAEKLRKQFQSMRLFTETICEPLSPEDCVIQSMPDVSPTRWHLAHTTWFFETFILSQQTDYQVFHPEFEYLFNSYYNTVGDQFPRPQRGFLSRPSVAEIWDYRRSIDEQIDSLLQETSDDNLLNVVEVGLHHEQQHQELMLTDIKHVLSCNPLFPVYRNCATDDSPSSIPFDWIEFDEGLYEIGHNGNGFAFDNESPRHRTFAEDFQIANRPVTNGEFLEFITDGGYLRPELWLSLGWNAVQSNGWTSPLYWYLKDDQWWQFTLSGLKPLNLQEPVCHVSFFEADAFARWSDARLPTEAEWEIASETVSMTGNFADVLFAANQTIHPSCESNGTFERNQPSKLAGDVWEWTASQYTAYPGYRAPDGALGEYNGKFMCNQFVLRGGSCATSSSHFRNTYRNFFPPDARWQFSGLRLAR